jgi:archaellum biogenesis protein FlaJ (TadC family)
MRVVLAVSPILGFALGFLHFSWVAIVVSGLALAIVLVVVLQNQGVDFFPVAAGAAACFAVTQIAYQIGVVARPPDRR